VTASIWGSPQTDKDLEPLVDYDANGYPPDGRARAVKLLRDADPRKDKQFFGWPVSVPFDKAGRA